VAFPEPLRSSGVSVGATPPEFLRCLKRVPCAPESVDGSCRTGAYNVVVGSGGHFGDSPG
jgi:hypothetical protein